MKSYKEIDIFLRRLQCDDLAVPLAELIQKNYDQLPLPGQGQTLARWQALASVAAHNLSLAKLFEGHTDALAILQEIGSTDQVVAGTWAVWAAEPPGQKIQVTHIGSLKRFDRGDTVLLSGTKAWCSGAHIVDQALITAWLPDGQRCLVAVSLRQPGVVVTEEGWAAVGMGASASVDVRLEHARGVLVGSPGDYLRRTGFTHGGAGIAACWYGASASISTRLLNASRVKEDPHALAHLGAIDVALASTATLLRETAAQIDANPMEKWSMEIHRVRLLAEATAQQVLQRVPRALGPGPLCKDRSLALLVADLPVFIRQCHAERDLAVLGQLRMQRKESSSWSL